MNNLGKSLVLVNLALSLLGLGWAVAAFLSPVDWGRTEARKAPHNPSERVAAKIDERLAMLEHVKKQVKPAVDRPAQAQARVSAAEGAFGSNHLWYVKELDRLRFSPADVKVEVKEVKVGPDGMPSVSAAQPYGVPVMDKVVPGIEKS